MTRDSSTRGIRSLFGRRRRISQDNQALTPLTILQAVSPSQQGYTTGMDLPTIDPHRVYPSSPDNLEARFAGGSVIDGPNDDFEHATFAPPQHSTRQEDEDLEMLVDGGGVDSDDAFSFSNSCGDIGGKTGKSQGGRASSAFPSSSNRSISALASTSVHTAARIRDRSDSIGAASIASVRSWKNLFRRSTLSQSHLSDPAIHSTGSVTSIRDLGISAPVAIQASTSPAVEIGELPSAEQHRPLRERASSPAMASRAHFSQDENVPPPQQAAPLRSVFDVDDDSSRRQILHQAVSRASNAPHSSNRASYISSSHGGGVAGLRKRSSSIASLSSLFGAAIGRGSRNKEKPALPAQPQATPGIALSSSSTSFTLLSAPQPAPLTAPSRKSILNPITIPPAAAAVSGQNTGSDLGCAPKHSHASSADVDGKSSSKRWTFRNRRKTAEVTVKTLEAMTQSRAVFGMAHAEEEEAQRPVGAAQGPGVSQVSLASSSALSGTATTHSHQSGSSSSAIAHTGSPVTSRPSGEPGATAPTKLLLNIGRWAHQASGRVRQRTSNSVLSQGSDGRSSQGYSASIYTSSSAPPDEGHSPAAEAPYHIRSTGATAVALGAGTAGASQPCTSPGSLNHWLRDIDFNLRGTESYALGTSELDDMGADLVPPRGTRSNPFDDLLSVQSNSGSAESIVVLIKPMAEPMDAEVHAGPRPQLSRRSTGASGRNSMKTALVPLLAQRPTTPPASKQALSSTAQRDYTVAPAEITLPASLSTPGGPSNAPTKLPTRSSAASQLCEVTADPALCSYDEKTEVIVQQEDSDGSTTVQKDTHNEVHEVQEMESQQIDPWDGIDSHLDIVAQSDSAAGVLAQMSQPASPRLLSPEAAAASLAKRSVLQPTQSLAAAHQGVDLRSNTTKQADPSCAQSETGLSANTEAIEQVVKQDEDGNVLSSQLTVPGSQSGLGEASTDLSVANANVILAQKIVTEAIALNTLPAALAAMPPSQALTQPLTLIEPSLINAATISQLTAVTELAIPADLLVGATVEQAVAVTASLANLGSMSMISNGSSNLAARASIEAVEPWTPTEAMMPTPSLASHSFSTAESDSDTSSDSLCSISNRVERGLSSFVDTSSTPVKAARALVIQETEHFDEWGSTPNGLMLDLGLDGKASPAHFEEAVRGFRSRQQRERERTQTLSQPPSTTETRAPEPNDETDGDCGNSGKAAEATVSLVAAPPVTTAQTDEKAELATRQKHGLRQHKSGNALALANVQISATMPEILRQQKELVAKRSSAPGTIVTLKDFLTELKAPVDLACPPPPLLSSSRRSRRSKTSDGPLLSLAQRNAARSALVADSGTPVEGEWQTSHSRAQTTSATMTTPRRSRKEHSISSTADNVPPSRTSSASLLSNLDSMGHGDDISLTREEWQRFAHGHLGATLPNSELDPDASRRAMHSSSPSPPPAVPSHTTIVEEDEDGARDDQDAGTGQAGSVSDSDLLAVLDIYDDAGEAAAPKMNAQPEGPRSSTPSPLVALGRSASINGPTPLVPAEQPAGLSQAPSTVLARCHTVLDDESSGEASTDSSPVRPTADSVAQYPADGLQMDEIQIIGACLGLLKQGGMA
ncbi:hypothetical protein V8E36_003474 [Tilletia maclaganii]